jgi:hypothetical protein
MRRLWRLGSDKIDGDRRSNGLCGARSSPRRQMLMVAKRSRRFSSPGWLVRVATGALWQRRVGAAANNTDREPAVGESGNLDSRLIQRQIKPSVLF